MPDWNLWEKRAQVRNRMDEASEQLAGIVRRWDGRGLVTIVPIVTRPRLCQLRMVWAEGGRQIPPALKAQVDPVAARIARLEHEAEQLGGLW